MTADPRLERNLPAILADLGAGPVPDYVDSLLARTARTRQRPGWVFPERWLPVDTATTNVVTSPPVRWRMIAIAALLMIGLVAGAVLVAGQLQRNSDATPPELQGQWRAELPSDSPWYASYGSDVELMLAPTAYRIKLRFGQIAGRVAASGNELIFTNGTEQNCAGSGEGRYAWEVTGAGLSLSPLVPDECPARATFFELVFTDQS